MREFWSLRTHKKRTINVFDTVMRMNTFRSTTFVWKLWRDTTNACMLLNKLSWKKIAWREWWENTHEFGLRQRQRMRWILWPPKQQSNGATAQPVPLRQNHNQQHTPRQVPLRQQLCPGIVSNTKSRFGSPRGPVEQSLSRHVLESPSPKHERSSPGGV